jgi:hypothetical protein
MHEKGYPDAEITHDMKPTYGDRTQLTLMFTVTQGKRSRRTATTPVPTPRGALFQIALLSTRC